MQYNGILLQPRYVNNIWLILLGNDVCLMCSWHKASRERESSRKNESDEKSVRSIETKRWSERALEKSIRRGDKHGLRRD